MGAYDALLSSIGFPAANAGNTINAANRNLQTQEAQLGFQGGLARQGILANQEGNGVLSSGETGTKLANQTIGQQYQQDNLEAQNAMVVAQQQASIDQATAAHQAQVAQLAQQTQQFNLTYAQQQQLINNANAPFDAHALLYPDGSTVPPAANMGVGADGVPNSLRKPTYGPGAN